MTERTEAEELASNDPELLEPPADGAYATIQLQSFFSRVLRPEAMGAGYKGLAASELRILLHLISRMEFRNKVKHSQVWLANDLGITPQAYCRGIATLERCDFVRKKPVSEESPRLIEYMVLNPLLVRRLSAKSLPDVLKMYHSLPNDKVTFKIRPNPAQKAQEHVAITKIGTETNKKSPLIPISISASTSAIPLRIEETYSAQDVDLESQLVRAAESNSESEALPEVHVSSSINKSKKRAPSPIPLPGLKTLYNPDLHLTATTVSSDFEPCNPDRSEG